MGESKNQIERQTRVPDAIWPEWEISGFDARPESLCNILLGRSRLDLLRSRIFS